MCVNAESVVAWIRSTYLQVGLRDQHYQSLPQRSKLPMGEALDFHPPRPEIAPANESFLVRSMVP